KTYTCTSCSSLPRDSLSLSWPIKADKLGHETLHEQVSRKYLLSVSLKDLHQGVAIYTQGPGAIIRVSPLDPKEKQLPKLRIQSPTGAIESLQEASMHFSTATQDLRDTNLILAELKPEFKSGKFILSSPAKQDLRGDDKPRY